MMEERKWTEGSQILLLDLVTVMVIGIYSIVNEMAMDEMLKCTILIVIFITVFGFVSQINNIRILAHKKNFSIILAGYVASLMLVLLTVNYELYNFWFFGTVFVSIVIHPYLGMMFQFVMTFLYCTLNGRGMEYFFCYFLLGLVLSILAKYMKKPVLIFYSIVISLSMNITILFIMNNFILEKQQSIDIFKSVLSTFLVILICILGERVLKLKNDLETGQEEPVTEQEAMVDPEFYTAIFDKQYPLQKELFNFSRELYIHSMMVGEVSDRAAQTIDADGKLARAGGIYHDIGKIMGKNYVEEGVLLVKEHHFPESITAIIRQHNPRTEKPKSREAAIVLLIDSIVSTVEYLEKAKGEDQVDTELIIENVFQTRFEKGTLEESGLSLQDYHKLKSFLLNNCF